MFVLTFLCSRLFLELETNYRKSEFGGRLVAYDGNANVYCLGPLPKDNYALEVNIPGRRPGEMRSFQFKLRKVSTVNLETLRKFLDGKLDYTPYDVINALEVILRHPLATKNCVVGRSIFNGENCEAISGGLDIWKGFFLSLRPGQGRLLLNVDTSTAAFYGAGNVVDLVRDYLGVPRNERLESLQPRERGAVEHFLRNVRIEVTHRENKRRYKIIGISPNGADQTFFDLEDGTKQSVAQYFASKYGDQPLRLPKMNCLQVGSPQRSIFIPMEFCRVPAGQRYIRKLDGQQTADMIKIANRKPSDRLETIRRSTALLEEEQQYLNEFKMAFGNQLLQVNGRVLSPPTIMYGQKSREPTIQPILGAWNLRDKAVEIGATVTSWAVLVFGRSNPQEIKAFVDELCVTCTDTGVEFRYRQPPIIQATNDVEGSVKEAFGAAARATNSNPQFILCVLPTDDAGLYGEIKRVTDTIIGLPSQCMLAKHTRRPNKQYCANLALKINLKLGGVNSSLGRQLNFIFERPTIVFGADVTHPGIGDASKPSIAAVVASLDIKMSRYAASVRVQGSRKEIIEDLRSMAKEQLLKFHELNKVRPHRILFYRDGVSEGQFAQVLEFELTALRAACKDIDPAYAPTITFVLVQKRHHTRFFVAQGQDADRSGNIPAGTVVDTMVCHPNQFDFFLCSHGGIQGTSRPTHYHVVHDENNFKADDLQLLSYHLCYTYGRCTRSVSVVPPAYYAHLVAFRARYHFRQGAPQSTESFTSVKPSLQSNMYFI